MGTSVTLRDVAQRAGVSIKTVSNVVRGEVHVAAATRNRVQAAIDELGYRPNLSARRLRTGRGQVIALAVPELLSPYFAALATEVIARAGQLGYTVLIEVTGGDPAAELAAARGLHDPMIDGVLLSPLSLDLEQLVAAQPRVPLVLLGERELAGPFDHVEVDNIAAAREAVRHLLGRGYRPVAAIGHPGQVSAATSEKRLEGYRLALAEAGMTIDPAWVPVVPRYSRRCGAEAMRALLAAPVRPRAVFCFADVLAAGAMRAIHEAGLRVPRDVAVVGFDDAEESAYTVPSLTTVRPDRTEIATLAIDALLERIGGLGERTGARLLRPSYRLVVRESSGG